MGWLGDIATKLQPGEPIYTLIYGGMIIFFCFFYTAMVFNPNDIADNLKKSGAFIPGIRPGAQSAKYIDSVVSKLTLVGRDLYHHRLPDPGIPDRQVQRSVLLWRHLPADHRGGDHGPDIPGAVPPDVQAV